MGLPAKCLASYHNGGWPSPKKHADLSEHARRTPPTLDLLLDREKYDTEREQEGA